MTSTTNIANINTFLCRDTYIERIIDIVGRNVFKDIKGRPKPCRFGEDTCKGVHDEEKIRVLPHIFKYNSFKKTNINWVNLYLETVKILNIEMSKIINLEHKTRIENISSLNFIEVIQLWRDMACFYRKLVKELPKKTEGAVTTTTHPSGYRFCDDIPKFYLPDNLEDIAWPFERLTRVCHVYRKFKKAVDNSEPVITWDLCLATGINCKEGIHHPNEMLCVEDFLTGTCSCRTLKEIEERELTLQTRLIEVSTELLELYHKKDEDEWVCSAPKKKKEDPKGKLQNEITRLNHLIKEVQTSRSVHYTDLGMIPFNQQYKEYQIAEEARLEIIKREEALRSWNHGVDAGKEVVKSEVKIMKLVKPSKKK